MIEVRRREMNTNDQQLALLRQIDAFLREARIRYWLRGGWALDFIVGEVTRAHGDVDLVTWKRHETRIRRLFEERGFTPMPRHASMDFQKHGVDVNVLFIEKGPGVVYTAGYRDAPRWREEALNGPPRRLAGLCCRTVSPQGLLEEIEKTPGWLGRPARQQHLEAAETLRRVLAASSQLPHSWRRPEPAA